MRVHRCVLRPDLPGANAQFLREQGHETGHDTLAHFEFIDLQNDHAVRPNLQVGVWLKVAG